MPQHALDGSKEAVNVSSRLKLEPNPAVRGEARVEDEKDAGDFSFGLSAGAPGSDGSQQDDIPPVTVPFRAFRPAEPAVVLELEPPPPAPPAMMSFGVSGYSEEETATVTYQPDPHEEDVCVLLHEIHTPDGVVYDISLPEPPDEAVSFGIGGTPSPLRFPVRRIVSGLSIPASQENGAAVSFGLGDTVADVVERVDVKHVLHLLKAPVNQQLLRMIADYEPQPHILLVEHDGEPGKPLQGADAWRSHFAPASEHRVLLFIHGFGSNTDASLPRKWMRTFAPHYDAMLAYDHPTISRDPLQNAQDLLALIPDDLRLNADVIVHSRGGLVARSLTELHPAVEKLHVRRLITCGSPHGGTALAQRTRWDRLVSIALTSESMLSTTAGARAGMTFAPHLLESILHAASQLIFDLPGLQAMDPESAFLQKLNAPGGTALNQHVHYAAVCSSVDASRVPQQSFKDALFTMATQAFLGVPNDLVVPTESMQHIDPGTNVLGGRIFHADVNHFEYFDNAEVETFVGEVLAL
jgi:pimeloyl-ACP methyl ester carboxylesterase